MGLPCQRCACCVQWGWPQGYGLPHCTATGNGSKRKARGVSQGGSYSHKWNSSGENVCLCLLPVAWRGWLVLAAASQHAHQAVLLPLLRVQGSPVRAPEHARVEGSREASVQQVPLCGGGLDCPGAPCEGKPLKLELERQVTHGLLLVSTISCATSTPIHFATSGQVQN